MSADTMREAFAPVEAHYKNLVMEVTWGHLAPKKNVTYRGRVTYAVGCYGNDPLNPTTLVHDWPKGPNSSPWFYEALHDTLREFKNEEGCVYEVQMTFRNYQFWCQRRLVLDANKPT